MTPWYNLQSASFRNTPFLFKEIGGTSGRRATPHEYPKREQGWAEDLGAKLKQFNVIAYVIGDDYRIKLNNLLNALNSSGAGIFVHPHFGRMSVQVGEVSDKIFDNHGGYATVTFNCFDSGEQTAPEASDNTQLILTNNVGQCVSDVNTDFENTFQTSELPGYALSNIINQATGYVDDCVEFFRQATDTTFLNDILSEAEALKSSISDLLSAPGDLANGLSDLIFRTETLFTQPPKALEIYSFVSNRWEGKRAEINERRAAAPTPIENSLLDIEQKASTALSHLTLAQVKSYSAGTIAGAIFSDTSSATNTRKILDKRLQTEALVASTLGNTKTFTALRKLSLSLLDDVNARVLLLPTIANVETTNSQPLLLTVYQLTGDAKNAPAILKRNPHIANPNIVIPGTSIEVLNS